MPKNNGGQTQYCSDIVDEMILSGQAEYCSNIVTEMIEEGHDELRLVSSNMMG